MVDMHCHLLYGADDGSETIEESLEALREEKRQGVDAIILTPHYRHGMFLYDTKTVYRHFLSLKEAAEPIGVSLYLGTEYHMDSRCISHMKSGRTFSLAGTEFILAEFSSDASFSEVLSFVSDLLFAGYVPIVAHAERCHCLTDDLNGCGRLREVGALLQINADALIGLDGAKAKRFCRQLIRSGEADMVASDCHGIKKRPCHLREACQIVQKKYGQEAAERLFVTQPGRIVKESGD